MFEINFREFITLVRKSSPGRRYLRKEVKTECNMFSILNDPLNIYILKRLRLK